MRTALLRSGSQLVLGQVVSQIFSFIRNLIIARIITPADFGIAATFAMTLSLMEMISNVASEMLLVQSPDGNTPKMQGTAQLLKVGRGIANACILFAIAIPMARLFGVPQAQWAFQCLAIYPLLAGFNHLDIYRVQREMRFMPWVWATAGSNGLATLVAIPLALKLRDYSIMLWVLVLQAFFSMVVSHAVADRRYAWAWNKSHAKSIFSFGWPLLINGLLMYGIFEGDRLVIGSATRLFPRSQFTLADLGVYSVAFGLTMAPSLLAANVGNSLFLPLLSEAQNDVVEFNNRTEFASQIMSLFAVLIAVPFILCGGWIIAFLYGGNYSAAGGFISWLAVMWAIRVLRTAPTVAAISRSDTRNAMFANILRSLALVGMLTAAAIGAPLVWIPVSGVVGEALALSLTIWRLHYRGYVFVMKCVRPFVAFIVAVGIGTIGAYEGIPRMGRILSVSACILTIAIASGTLLLLFPQLYHDCVSLVRLRTKGVALATAPAYK